MIRQFEIHDDMISCTNCDLCYHAIKGSEFKEYRTFCQEFGINICSYADEENNERAKKCPYWIFCGYKDSYSSKGLSIRSVMVPVAPHHERYYEKDNEA